MFKRLSLSLRTLFSLTPSRSPSPYSIFVAQCSTSPPPHITYPHPHSHPDPRTVRVSVWWDFDNCDLPSGVSVFRGAQAIAAAIESSGIKGPIHFTAFGDMVRLRKHEEASSTDSTNYTDCPEIKFTDIVPGEDRITADDSVFLEVMLWVEKNPPPVHLFLITVFGGSTFIVNHLRSSNYNLLLAAKESPPGDICSAATILWNWDALVRGENLTGRYFNQPPNDTWYGHYEGSLEALPAFAPRGEPYEEFHHEVFSQDSFWEDLQTFLSTDVGSFFIAEARTREKMAYYLRKYGPSVLKSVMKSDVLLLVERLMEREIFVDHSS